MTTAVLAVIPLRLASVRVPKKILADIGGQTLSERTVGQALKAFRDEPSVRVLAAVDSELVAGKLRAKFPSLEVIVTDPQLPSGTDRVCAAVRQWLEANPGAKAALKGVLNIQGDMPFAGLAGLREAARYFVTAAPTDLARHPMVTLAQDWPAGSNYADLAAVKVISAASGTAIYFSRHPIPHSREPLKKGAKPAGQLHLGLYGYTLEALARLAAHEPIDLERAEGLEQLRALWLGIPILVIPTAPGEGEDFRGIDTPKDLSWARRFAKPRLVKKKPHGKPKPARKTRRSRR